MDSLFAKYLKERKGFDTIFTDKSFVSFICSGNECFVGEIFVDKERRNQGEFKSLIENLKKIGLEQGCEVITGNIDLRSKGASTILASSLALGFQAKCANADVVLMALSIKE